MACHQVITQATCAQGIGRFQGRKFAELTVAQSERSGQCSMRPSPSIAGMKSITRQVKKQVKKKWIQVIRIKHLAEFDACKLACKALCKTTCKCRGNGLPRPFANLKGERDPSRPCRVKSVLERRRCPREGGRSPVLRCALAQEGSRDHLSRRRAAHWPAAAIADSVEGAWGRATFG